MPYAYILSYLSFLSFFFITTHTHTAPAPPTGGPSKPRPTAHGIAIRRPPTNHRAQARVAHTSSVLGGQPPSAEGSTSTSGATAHERASQSANPNDEDPDRDDDDMDISPSPPASELSSQQLNSNEEGTEQARLRRALRPRPVPGLQDWGIPPAPTGPVDAEVSVRLSSLSLPLYPLLFPFSFLLLFSI